jgi:hypothetical protein
MTVAQPQTTGTQLFNTAWAYLRADVSPTQFEMRRLEKEAEKLQRVDAVSAFAVRAVLSAIKWDTSEMHSELLSLLHLDRSAEMALNASLVCRMVNDSDGSVRLARQAWQLAPKNTAIVAGFYSSLLRAGRLHEAHRLSAELELGEVEREQAKTVARTIATMERIALAEERLLEELRAGFEEMTVRRKRNQQTNFGTQVDPESDAVSLLVMLRFVGNYDDEAELAEGLTMRLIDTEDWNPAELAIQYEPMLEAMPDAVLTA